MDMSGDGNIIAIGAPFEHANGLGDSGTVRVFYLSGNTWTILPDSGPHTLSSGAANVEDAFVGESVNDELGRAVKLSYDGRTIAFNITNEDEAGTDRGQVKVFTYANGAWSNKGDGINGTTNSQQFGLAIDMSDDGDHLIIGANHTAPNPPEVRVFKWDGSSWGLKGSILNHTTSTDGFGHAVAISNDGSVIALGIRNADSSDGADADNRGIVRMYHWSGSSWTLKNTLEYPYKEATNRDDDFGTTVNLSGDGKRLIVSSPWSDNSGDSGGTPAGTAGQLWVYEYYAGNWSLRRPVPYTSAPTFDGYQSSARTNAGGIGLMGNHDSVLGAGIENDYWLNMNVATLGGQSIAISRDGAAIIAGEWAYNSSSAGGDRGRVRVWSMPSNIKSIWGSNDDVNWTRIVRGPTREEATSNVAGIAFGFSEMAKFTNIDNPNYYKYHAIVGDAFTSIRDVKLFGVRNRGSSTLHDGTLTLTKNLDVPRIGPPPDTDDTPRRDRLVVEYNTSTNPTFDGVVRDTSGRGNDGIFIGTSPKYDANEKYLQVTTAGDAIQSLPLNNPGGAYIHSFSIWFKMVSINRVICQIGADGSGTSSGLYITSNNINHYFYGNDINYVVSIGVGSWNHIVATYDGGTSAGSRRLWFNGNEVISSDPAPTTAAAAPIIEANTTVRVGSRKADTYVDSKISNFKLYDTVLTAEEAKTLYDMGRCSNAIPKTLHIMGGMLKYNNDINRLQIHNGVGWSTIGGVTATGGTVSSVGDYTVHTFTSSGTFVLHTSGEIEYLIVAGGGGGGSGYQGGGGGAGGLRNGSIIKTAGSYTVTVGAGGAGGTSGSSGTPAANGSNSSALGVACSGGGRGAAEGGGGGYAQTGGSGGGGTHGMGNVAGAGTVSAAEGNNGGAGFEPVQSGGGGGAGGVGETATAGHPGNGGDGLFVFGAYYAGGGGGSARNSTNFSQGSLGGKGGGGNALSGSGTPNTGGGGGGSIYHGASGAGGSGIVILRYL
jgi:hypothetical protein